MNEPNDQVISLSMVIMAKNKKSLSQRKKKNEPLNTIFILPMEFRTSRLVRNYALDKTSLLLRYKNCSINQYYLAPLHVYLIIFLSWLHKGPQIA